MGREDSRPRDAALRSRAMPAGLACASRVTLLVWSVALPLTAAAFDPAEAQAGQRAGTPLLEELLQLSDDYIARLVTALSAIVGIDVPAAMADYSLLGTGPPR